MSRPPTLVLSVLDQTPVPDGSTPADAVAETLALARAAERLGYRRYWLAEHHNTPSLAGTAPEILVAAVAAATSTIRVGSGGVLLPYYSPLKVAEVFRMLHTLYPGRIDLGVGRAAGADPAAEAALLASGGASGDRYFANHLADLVTFVGPGFGAGPVRGGQGDGEADHNRPGPDDDHPYAGVRAMPGGPGGPTVWLLGSSGQSGAAAAAFGLPLAFAHFIAAGFGPEIVAGYRRRFRPGQLADQPGEPEVLVAVTVVCADTDAEADRLASATDLWRRGPEGAHRPPILPPPEVDAGAWTALVVGQVAQRRERMVVGAPDRARDALVALAGQYGVGELMVVTVCHDAQARLRSYELLAEAFDLHPGPA
ncbi:MAG TPA: LLM class flavin-dependent oxidoreductase [Acidimicrobiales bacterium]|nr:LLM class flavin-dependent oxidoreductase [Acidimicrobiales bacterium]